jgi:hypothetical protein
LFIVLSPHFLIHDVKTLLSLLLIKLSYRLTSILTRLSLTGQQRPFNIFVGIPSFISYYPKGVINDILKAS